MVLVLGCSDIKAEKEFFGFVLTSKRRGQTLDFSRKKRTTKREGKIWENK